MTRAQNDQLDFHYTYDLSTNNLSIAGDLPAQFSRAKIHWLNIVAPKDKDHLHKTYEQINRRDISSFDIHYSITLENGESIRVRDRGALAHLENSSSIICGSICQTIPANSSQDSAQDQSFDKLLAAAMVHDFRNLLGGMQNILEWCTDQSQDLIAIQEALRNTLNYTNDANELIKSFLTVINNEKQTKKEAVNIALLLKDMSCLISHIIGNNIKLVIDTDQNLPLLNARKSELQRLILNLCSNARNAMAPKGGELLISLKNNAEENSIALTVRDNGCGMSAEDLDKIHQAFYTNSQNGTGLGMWAVKEISDRLHAAIHIDSQENCGTSITITLPSLREHDQEKSPRQTSDGENLRQFHFEPDAKTILFVEDDQLIQAAVQDWLKSFGFRVISSQDGQEALEVFRQNKDQIDLIIQDKVLPGIKGDELIRYYAEEAPTIPIILTSAYNSDKSDLCQKLIFAHLIKPFKINSLAQTINDALLEEN